MRAAVPSDLPMLFEFQSRIDDGTDPDVKSQLLAALVMMAQVIIFETGKSIDGYVAIACFSDEAEQKYLRDGEIDLSSPGPNLWVLECSGRPGFVTDGEKVFAELVRKLGFNGYRFYRERDGRSHEMRMH